MILNHSSLKFCSKKCKTLINASCRLPNGLMLPFENFLKDVFNKTKNSHKIFHMAGDFNKNFFDYEKCEKFLIKNF